MSDDKKSEWAEQDEVDQFSAIVRNGVEMVQPDGTKKTSRRFRKKKSSGKSIDELYDGVLKGNRTLLAQSITLIESNAEHDFEKAQQLLQNLLPHSGNAIRIGITGVPGAGKSTFIESFGSFLCDQGLTVAVLAIDPSSSVSGGSILGDKTRMEQLARNPKAFIRPSPSSGKLGGVHRKTRETMLLCEAAGFDVILIETVGVGQSEVIVRDMVDFFLLLVITGAGDELQGMKKGIMELADAIIVNKADGDNLPSAIKTKEEYNRILHFLQPATKGWVTKSLICSAVLYKGIDDIWNLIKDFQHHTAESGAFFDRRRQQTKEWVYELINDTLKTNFFNTPEVKELLPKMENEVMAGSCTVTAAVERLFQAYNQKKRS